MSPPPPPYTPPPPAGPGAAQQVQGPAIGLIVTGAIGLLFAVLGLLMNVLGMGMSGLQDLGGDYGSQYWAMWSGGLGVVSAVIALAAWGFVIWAAMKMKVLEQRTAAIVASIVAMIPCFCPTCVVGIPIGIWSLVVLLKPEVKAAFKS
jgi:hypothetical protein